MTDEPFYRTSFSKHLHSLARSNYFRRYLDSDDRAFLEYVRRTGSANANMPGYDCVLLEELDFWHLPYTVARDVDRRIGKRPRSPETKEELQRRQAKSSKWHAQRIISEQQKAIAAAELAREQKEYDAAQARRKQQVTITDKEWNAAAPAKFGKTIKRHHIPQWLVDEKNIRTAEEQIADEKKQKRLQRKKAEQDELDAERERQRAYLERLAAARAAEKERHERERLIAEAAETIRRAESMERVAAFASTGYPSTEHLKQAILTLTYGHTAGFVWTNEHLMRSLGITDEDLLNRCLKSLIKEGRLRKV